MPSMPRLRKSALPNSSNPSYRAEPAVSQCELRRLHVGMMQAFRRLSQKNLTMILNTC
jgi:hypothetical protein